MTKEETLKATHTGKLNLGEIQLTCAVLEDGSRVLTQTDIENALGRYKSSSKKRRSKITVKDKTGVLPSFLAVKSIEPFISEDLKYRLIEPKKCKLGKGNAGFAIPAELLPEICKAWLGAKDAGVLSDNQLKTAEQAYILIKALATVGIIALVDEATGYQDIRKKDALQKILDAFISKELAAWIKRFPDEFYSEMFRLKKWNWDSKLRPGVVGRYTNDIVYERLAPKLVEELKKKNPRNKKGTTKVRDHQWLTTDVGHPALSQHLYAVIGLMRTCQTWDQFKRLINRAFPKKGDQLEMFHE